MHNWKDSLQTIMHNGNFLKSDFSKSSIRNRLIFVALVKTNFDSFLCSIAKLLWCKLPSGVFDKTDMHNKLSDIGNNKVETRNPEKVNSTNKVIQFLLLNLKLVEIKLWSKINSRRVCNVFYVISIVLRVQSIFCFFFIAVADVKQICYKMNFRVQNQLVHILNP